jgi:hypothetical protein
MLHYICLYNAKIILLITGCVLNDIALKKQKLPHEMKTIMVSKTHLYYMTKISKHYLIQVQTRLLL